MPFEIRDNDNRVFPPNIHPEAEAIIVLRGELSMSINHVAMTLTAGDIAFIFPNIVHSYLAGCQNRSTCLLFSPYFAGEYAKTLNAMAPVNPVMQLKSLHRDVPGILRTLHDKDLDDKLLRAYLTLLTGHLLKPLELTASAKSDDKGIIENISTYIGSHFRDPLSLDDVAAALGVSKYCVSRYFSQRLKCGFSAYVNTLRAHYAEHMLTSKPDLSITDVCYESGFDSLSTFYRSFRQSFGESPGKFRGRASR